MKPNIHDKHRKSLLCGPYCKQFNKICHTYSTLRSILKNACLIFRLLSVFLQMWQVKPSVNHTNKPYISHLLIQQPRIFNQRIPNSRTGLSWVITQWIVVYCYWHFRTSYQSHIQFLKDISGKPINPIFLLTPEVGIDRLSRNVRKKLPLLAAW